jgi:hypothetical protein
VSLFAATDFDVYARVKETIQRSVERDFEPRSKLHLTSPTFFSRITAKQAVGRSVGLSAVFACRKSNFLKKHNCLCAVWVFLGDQARRILVWFATT